MLNGGSFYDYYETQDGRYFAVGSLEPQFMSGLAAALDLPILMSKGMSFDPDDRKTVKVALQEKFRTQSFSIWQQLFKSLDICVEPVLGLEEALSSTLSKQRGWVVDVPLSTNNEQSEPQLACPIKFSRSQMHYGFIGQKLGEGKW
jgi:crotonobetainyl-CoA:carnitine CoA-transferase CaiB-like acyl-CoA transferase